MSMHYEAEWSEGALDAERVDDVDGLLRAALGDLREREIDRGITLVGPHRDDWRLVLNGLDARSHASQGEQRTLALALRLAGPPPDRVDHRHATRCCCSTTCSASSTPTRAAALVAHLPGHPDPADDRRGHSAGIDAERT